MIRLMRQIGQCESLGEGKLFHSHRSNVSAGVAMIFNRTMGETNKRVTNIVRGRVLTVQTEINGTEFMYTPPTMAVRGHSFLINSRMP